MPIPTRTCGTISFLLLLAVGCAPPPPLPPPADPAPATEAPAAVVAAEPAWEAAAPLPERRTEVSAATDGRFIYLAGGFGPPEGEERATAPRTLWRYDAAADRWDPLTEIPEGVHHTAFAYHDGRLFILGGFRETSFAPVANVRIYDLRTGRWSEGAPMPTPRGAAGFTVLDGRIHVIGGNAEAHVHGPEHGRVAEDRSVGTHEAYDVAADRWVRLAPMPTARNHLGAAAVDGRIHAVLGRVEGDMELTVHEIYDPETDAWRPGEDVPTGRSGVAVVERRGQVYAFGGETFGDDARTFDDAERFDPATGRWERLRPMPSPRHGLGAAVVGDAIHVISGGPRPGFTFGDAHEVLPVEAGTSGRSGARE